MKRAAYAVTCSAIAVGVLAAMVRHVLGLNRLDAVAVRLTAFAKEHRDHDARYLEQGAMIGYYCPQCNKGEVFNCRSQELGTLRLARDLGLAVRTDAEEGGG